MAHNVLTLVENSAIASYPWKDRGIAPAGFTKGMALSFAHIVRRWERGDSAAYDMARANTHNADTDALSWYAGIFDSHGMHNDRDGLETLRHLWVMLMGLGMRESSGRHCVGRDMSAENVEATTAEAGLLQMSWNMESCSPEMQRLFDAYSQGGELSHHCILAVFSEKVSCEADDWECYGDGPGFDYQRLAKICPAFAVDAAAIGLRYRRKHWGPINEYACEIRPEADELFQDIQAMVTGLPIA